MLRGMLRPELQLLTVQVCPHPLAFEEALLFRSICWLAASCVNCRHGTPSMSVLPGVDHHVLRGSSYQHVKSNFSYPLTSSSVVSSRPRPHHVFPDTIESHMTDDLLQAQPSCGGSCWKLKRRRVSQRPRKPAPVAVYPVLGTTRRV